jgi:NitT/TauT family transport system substrate-binding protein
MAGDPIPDLEGKTVAVNTLGNVLDVTLNTALEAAGVDRSRVEYLEVPDRKPPARLGESS